MTKLFYSLGALNFSSKYCSFFIKAPFNVNIFITARWSHSFSQSISFSEFTLHLLVFCQIMHHIWTHPNADYHFTILKLAQSCLYLSLDKTKLTEAWFKPIWTMALFHLVLGNYCMCCMLLLSPWNKWGGGLTWF